MEEYVGKSYEEKLEIVDSTTHDLINRRTRADLIEVFKMLKGFEGIDEKMFFKRRISNPRGILKNCERIE